MEPIYYVGIGASAGGLEALEAFFTRMPPDSGLAFIVIQHLSPDYKSLMVELLSKRTPMQVRRAEDDLTVEPDTVYLIPPRKHLTIFHGKLLLKDPDLIRGINLPIDVFFKSLAEDQGEKAVGIILSGTGSDGVRGIRAIKEAGGMVIVQSEESAKFDGMPRAALATGLADLVLPPEEMPDKLISFSRKPFSVPPDQAKPVIPDEDCLTRIFSLLRDQTKVDFTLYKPNTVLRRIERRIAFNQASDIREYLRILETRPSEVLILYKELLIGVTSFFRDREVFEELAETHLPQLLTTISQRDVRFWTIGCSTGEEAYTLAILAQESMEKIKRNLSIKIFATDIDRDAIVQAGSGIYPESITADIPSSLMSKYFIRREDHYQIQRKIREMVVFARHDIIKDPPFTNIDFITCRNLLIYLQPVLQTKVMEYINYSLNPGGLLVLGTSETPGDASDYFEPLHHKYKIYRSRGRKRMPADRPAFEPPNEVKPRRYPAAFARGFQSLAQREEERIVDRLLSGLAEESVIFAAAVNERMELIYLVGEASGLLRLPTGKLHNDISRMAVKDLSIPLTTGLQKAFHQGVDVKYTNLRLPYNEGVRIYQLKIKLLPGKRGQEQIAGVFLQEMPSPRESPSKNEAQVFDINKEAEQRIQDLEQELQFTKENLQATIEELETSNEELQATNEELLAGNEELQSTNEELQSVNEELHTVNAEYQTKIIELTELTNDFDNLLAATKIATLFLDENLEVRRFTPELAKVLRITEADIGRPITHLVHRLADCDLSSSISSVVETGRPFEKEVRTVGGDWLLMRILPYHRGSQRIRRGNHLPRHNKQKA